MYKNDYTPDFNTRFGRFPEDVIYDTYFIGPQFRPNPYWDEDLFDQLILEYKYNHKKPNKFFRNSDLGTDSQESDAYR